MVNEIPTIDIEAFEAFDWRRLLRVLRRGIDEEIAERMNGERFNLSGRDRDRLRCLCTLVGTIQGLIVVRLASKPVSAPAASA